jgi:hypothetical protein
MTITTFVEVLEDVIDDYRFMSIDEGLLVLKKEFFISATQLNEICIICAEHEITEPWDCGRILNISSIQELLK